MTYTVKVVDMSGSEVVTLANANVKTIEWTLNSEDVVTFESPKEDFDTDSVELLASEVQIYRDSQLLSWAVVTSQSADSGNGATTFQARGLWWYFRRRFFGTAGRIERLPNGDFESGLTGWTEYGIGAAVYSDPPPLGLPSPFTGSNAVYAYGTPGENNFLENRFTFSYSWYNGHILWVTAWFHGVAFAGPAAMGFGMWIGWIVDGFLVSQAVAPIDDDTPTGEWTLIQKGIRLPPTASLVTGTVAVRLYWPGGLNAWDRASAVLADTTGTAAGGEDQTTYAERIINYAQNGVGKSDLNIGYDTPPSGVIVGGNTNRIYHFHHYDHEWIADAIDQVASVPDGFDYSIETTASTRTFTTHYPKRGTDRTGSLTLTLGDGGNLASYQLNRDGVSVATSVVTRGEGPGSEITREEGGAVDTTGTDGLVLEDVINAPPEVTVRLLDDYAADEVAARSQVIDVLTVVTHQGAGDLIGLPLVPGDLVYVSINDGAVSIYGDYRIVQIRLDCPTETMALTLNKWVA